MVCWRKKEKKKKKSAHHHEKKMFVVKIDRVERCRERQRGKRAKAFGNLPTPR